MRKLIYQPFGIVAGLIGGKLGRKLFETLWSKVDRNERPPSPRKGDADWRKAVAGAALEAAAYAGAKAAADRATAKSFHHLTGLWPEKSEGEKAAEDLATVESPRD
jgi:hypothetical protein